MWCTDAEKSCDIGYLIVNDVARYGMVYEVYQVP